jgi:hypothetical protein
MTNRRVTAIKDETQKGKQRESRNVAECGQLRSEGKQITTERRETAKREVRGVGLLLTMPVDWEKLRGRTTKGIEAGREGGLCLNK